MVLASTVGVSKASISLYLPCIIRGGNSAATNGAEPPNSWSPMSAPLRSRETFDLSKPTIRDLIGSVSTSVYRY
jgi:hypothetical protein